jgi:hypothetical protein
MKIVCPQNQRETIPEEEFYYQGVEERTYTTSHPDVIKWSSFFTDRYESCQIFERFNRSKSESRQQSAISAAVYWYHFSEFAPWFDCQAAAMLTKNQMRHYVIQVAFEELGMRKENEIHSDLFWQAAFHIGAEENHKASGVESKEITKPLAFLRSGLLSCASDSEILGMALGFEIPARENIETLFECMAFNEESKSNLAKTKFFKLHRQIEAEHIRLSVANFLRFCESEEERAAFTKGFDLGVKFWDEFWLGMAACLKARGTNAKPD